ncbi:MAG: hypothetical protein ACFCVG_02585 [Kineosporiaceae bacterium]
MARSRRRPRPAGGGSPPPLRADAVERHPDGDWVVRRLTGAASTKTYRCPGCSQEIRPATPHVVAWPADAPLLGGEAADSRRHWHTACWGHRTRRR